MEKKLTDTMYQSIWCLTGLKFLCCALTRQQSRKRDRDQINCYNTTIAILLDIFVINRLLYYSVLSLF